MKTQKPKLVVLFEHGWDNKPFSSAFIRLINPLTYPMIQEKYDVEFKSDFYGDNCDAVIIDRLWRPDISLKHAKSVLNDIHRKGVKFIYACDDNFLDIPLIEHGWFTAEKADIVKYFLSSSNQVWVTTAQLEKRFRDYSDNIIVIPNYFDDRLIPPFHKRLEDKNSTIHLGYMGTFTHIQDLKIISEELNEIGRKYSNEVELHIIGIGDKAKIDQLLKNIKVEIINPYPHGAVYPDFVNWFCKTINWNIALSPLAKSSLNECKSDLKFLDYSLIHAAGIYSDVTPYTSSKFIVDNYSGIIASNCRSDWFTAIDTLIWNSSLRDKIADNAYEIFINAGTLKTGIDYWRRALEKIF